MLVNKEDFEKQVAAVVQQMTATAEGLANDGFLQPSGIVLAGVQTIKALYTRLQEATKPAEPPPKGRRGKG